MEGQLLGNRYELIEKIGGGGMALVYKAKCNLLNRYVAVKILRPEFTNDEEFVKRFRIEAQAAASLSHPNIVSIYDVGKENGTYYIVMEYINGITLKEYISRKGALNWNEAVNIAVQICSAIEQAHRNHIVHRDIKPHNILLTKDGIAKVTDFGIARAVSSSTITMAGSTIGSVHYFSPEQARGGYIDEKSDLYSLGIALYEMLTGKVPFDGESPVTIAIKHLQDKAQEPIELNPDIPKGLNDIVMRAIEKDQNKRYQSASDLLSDLYSVLKEPDIRFIPVTDPVDFPTRKLKSIDEADLIHGEEGEDIKSTDKKDVRRDRITTWLAVVTSMIIISISVYLGYSLVIPYIMPESNEYTVENFVGGSLTDAADKLKKYNIEVKENYVNDDNVQKGIIMSQSIIAGQKLKLSGSNTIQFDVSGGPELVKLPNLKNVEGRIAEADLKKLGLGLKFVDEYNETVANGYVIKTDPGADQELKPGTVVSVFRSIGPEAKKVKVPNLTGKTRAEAQQVLLEYKLAVGKMEPADVVSNIAKVIKQSPAANTEVNEGDAVDLTFENIQAQNTPAITTTATATTLQTLTTQQPGTTQIGTGVVYNRRIVNERLALDKPENYDTRIRVYIEIFPSDTGKAEVLMNSRIKKESFPLTLEIPVPEKGTTGVKVYLDNKLYTEFYRY